MRSYSTRRTAQAGCGSYPRWRRGAASTVWGALLPPKSPAIGKSGTENREFRTGEWKANPIGPFAIPGAPLPVFHCLVGRGPPLSVPQFTLPPRQHQTPHRLDPVEVHLHRHTITNSV